MVEISGVQFPCSGKGIVWQQEFCPPCPEIFLPFITFLFLALGIAVVIHMSISEF